jgi:flavin reductase (DIM6/NTAB) family NADH-FMN oxidoreductase RutF
MNISEYGSGMSQAVARIGGDAFKAIMSAAPGPVAVVTAFDRDYIPYGLTMSAVCSVSLEPPLVLVCLATSSNTLSAIRETAAFTVNYLPVGEESTAMTFASKTAQKFENVTWNCPENGVGGPLLAEHAAYAACRVINSIEAGDHVIFVGEVVEGAAQSDRSALAYANRRFFSSQSQCS